MRLSEAPILSCQCSGCLQCPQKLLKSFGCLSCSWNGVIFKCELVAVGIHSAILPLLLSTAYAPPALFPSCMVFQVWVGGCWHPVSDSTFAFIHCICSSCLFPLLHGVSLFLLLVMMLLLLVLVYLMAALLVLLKSYNFGNSYLFIPIGCTCIWLSLSSFLITPMKMALHNVDSPCNCQR